MGPPTVVEGCGAVFRAKPHPSTPLRFAQEMRGSAHAKRAQN